MKRLLLLLLLASPLRAASWYLDDSVGSSGNGQAWATAWKASANVVWGAGGVTAGDTLYVAAGSYSQLSVTASGTSGSRITIRAAQDASYAGQATFDGGATGPALLLNDNDYITVSGEYGGSRNLRFYNGKLSTGYDFIISGPNYSTNCIFTYLEVEKGATGIGIHLLGANPAEISYCYIHDIRGQAAIDLVTGGDRSAYGLIAIRHNTISTSWAVYSEGKLIKGPDGLQAYGSIDFYNNVMSAVQVDESVIIGDQHPDQIQAQAEYWRIYNNQFKNCGDSCIDFDTFFQGHLQDIQIYNNEFVITDYPGVYPWGVRFYGAMTGVDNLTIANNTFVDYYGLRVLSWDASGNPAVTDTLIQNNIFYNSGYVYIVASTGATQADWNFDYNLINAGAHGRAANEVTLDGSSYTQSHPQTAAPTFVVYSERSNSNNLRIQSSDTAAKDNGATLSSYFTIDKDGNTRSAPWNIGAYEGFSSCDLNEDGTIDDTDIQCELSIIQGRSCVSRIGSKGEIDGTRCSPGEGAVIDGCDLQKIINAKMGRWTCP